ncbi:MAG: hypothetical protein OHK0057_37480 [Thermoflexibacter sp.]
MKRVLIYILFLTFSCQSSIFQKKESKLKEMLATYQKSSALDKQIYLITITSGCGGCMQVVADYIKENIADERMHFIVSCPSQKEVSFTFNHQIRNSNNFLIDKQLIAIREGLVNNTHPKVYYCEKGKIVDEGEISLDSAEQVFIRIKAFLDSNN